MLRALHARLCPAPRARSVEQTLLLHPLYGQETAKSPVCHKSPRSCDHAGLRSAELP